MNISEFERHKPKKTFKSIKDAIEKYEGYMSDINPIMDEADAAYIEACKEILADLQDIKRLFLSGE